MLGCLKRSTFLRGGDGYGNSARLRVMLTTRRKFLLVGAVGAIAPARVIAQARPVKIGMLSPRPLSESVYAPGVVRRLAELGYRQGGSMTLEFR